MIKIIIGLVLLICVSSHGEGFLQNFWDSFSSSFNMNQVYSEEKALNLFYYTKIAVCNVNTIQTWTCGDFCKTHPDLIDVQAVYNKTHEGQAFTGYSPSENRIIVAFRSTQNLNNFIQDTKFLKTNFGCTGCQVHLGFLSLNYIWLGFYETYLDVKNTIIPQVMYLKQKYSSAKISIVGHSLGGAIGVIAAVDLTNMGYKVNELYTYGCPRVGNDQFSKFVMTSIGAEIFRITHYQDLIVHSPPQSMYYQHITQEVYYNEPSTSYQVCSSTNAEDPACAYSAWAVSITDHTSYFGVTKSC